VESVAFSPDSNALASGSDDGTVRVWDVTTGDLLTTLEGHTDIVWSVAFNPVDGRVLASGSRDGTVRLWAATGAGALLQTLNGETPAAAGVLPPGRVFERSGSVFGVAFSADGQALASANEDGTVKVWGVGGE
jgi:WD40 repeat protein